MEQTRASRHPHSQSLGKWARFLDMENGFQLRLVLTGLTIIFLVGIFSVFVRVPTTWFDTTSHYYRAIQLSNGDLLEMKDSNPAWYGGEVSSSQTDFILEAEDWRNRALRTQDDSKRTAKFSAFTWDWISDLSDKEYTDEKEFQIATNAIPYTPVVYSPYILVLQVNKLLKLNIVTEYILMRLAGFTLGFILLLFTIRAMPFSKWTVVAIALNPTSIGTMSSITADVYTTGMSMLFIAYSVRLGYQFIKRERIRPLSSLTYAFLIILLSFAKIPSFFLLALPVLYLVMDKERRLLGAKGRRFLVISLSLSILFTLVWLLLVRGVNTGAFFNRNVDTVEQIKYIVTHLPSFLMNYIRSMVTFPYFLFQLAHENGEVGLIKGIPVFVYLVALLFSPMIQDRPLETDKNRESFVVGTTKVFTFLAILAAIFLILYLQFSEIGSTTVEGVQARYFIPYWLLLVSFLPIRRLKTNWYALQTGLAFLTLVPLLVYIGSLLTQLR